MKSAWRLLVHEPADGYTNMAVDEALMLALADGLAPPTLRFFRWSPPCVSLGYFQSALDEVDLAACREMGIDCVRRPTGGRAILHDAELTYSVTARVDDRSVSGSIVESYRKISLALLAGLRELDIAAEMKPVAPQDSRHLRQVPIDDPDKTGLARPATTAACFDVPSDYEIAVDGRKLVGSAQTRHGEVVLQHGSVLLDFDAVQTFTALKPPPGTERAQVAKWLAARVTSLNELLSRDVSFTEVAAALSTGFANSFGVEVVPGTLSDAEWRLAQQLKAEKYSTESWNLKR